MADVKQGHVVARILGGVLAASIAVMGLAFLPTAASAYTPTRPPLTPPQPAPQHYEVYGWTYTGCNGCTTGFIIGVDLTHAPNALGQGAPDAAYPEGAVDTKITIPNHRGVSLMAADPNARTLWVANSGALYAIDTTTNTVVATYTQYAKPSELFLSPTGASMLLAVGITVFLLHVTGSSLSVVATYATRTDAIWQLNPVGQYAKYPVWSATGKTLYAWHVVSTTTTVITTDVVPYDTATGVAGAAFATTTVPNTRYAQAAFQYELDPANPNVLWTFTNQLHGAKVVNLVTGAVSTLPAVGKDVTYNGTKNVLTENSPEWAVRTPKGQFVLKSGRFTYLWTPSTGAVTHGPTTTGIFDFGTWTRVGSSTYHLTADPGYARGLVYSWVDGVGLSGQNPSELTGLTDVTWGTATVLKDEAPVAYLYTKNAACPSGLCGTAMAMAVATSNADVTPVPAPLPCTWAGCPPTPAPTTGTHNPQHATGYWLVGADGGIFTFGNAQFHGSTGSLHLQRPVVGIVPSADHAGYMLVASDGGLFAFGDAQFHGSLPGLGLHPAGSGLPHSLVAPVDAVVGDQTGGGYLMVAADGGVFAFGNAHFYGSCYTVGGCTGSVVQVIPTKDWGGYWVISAGGGVYSFGDAGFYGSAAGRTFSPIVAAAAASTGKGYWLVNATGNVFAFGAAHSYGTPASTHGVTRGFIPTTNDQGYLVVTAAGGVDAYGNGTYEGGMAGRALNAPIIAAAGW